MTLINQNDFTHGELDPRMIAKSNLEIFRKGAERLRDVVITPMGNVLRRFGTIFVDNKGDQGNEIMFAEFVFNDDITYLLFFTDANIAVYRDDVFKVDIAAPWPGVSLINLEPKWSQTDNAMIITHPDYEPRKLARGGDDVTWTLSTFVFKNLPGYDYKQNYDSNNFSLSVVTVGQGRNLKASADIFDASYVGGYFETYGKEDLEAKLGVAQITAFVDAKNVTVEITSEFDSNLVTPNQVSGKNVYLAEPAFSVARGWPSSVTFYEGRQWFGGSKSLPHGVFGSVVDDFRNYDIGTGLDSDAVQETIGGHKIGIIKHILGARSLQVFTSKGEYTAGQAEDRAITPGTFSVKLQSAEGIENPRPITLDNQTFFVKSGGRGVMSFLYSNDTQAYTSDEVSRFAPHLIRNPVDAAVLSGSTTDSANYMFLINEDGTLAIYQSVLSQNVSAWTLSETVNTTNGKFIRCIEIDNNIYFAIERTVDGSTAIYIEKLSFDAYTDSAFQHTYGSPTSVITGLGHLEGQTVKVKGDGYVLASAVVESGQITLDEPRTTVEIGLPFSPQIVPMPLAFETQEGDIMYKRKTINKVYVDYFESIGIYVDDVLIPNKSFGPDVLDQPPTVKTGVYEYSFILKGWDARQMVTISQQDPLPMTIVGIGFEVNS